MVGTIRSAREYLLVNWVRGDVLIGYSEVGSPTSVLVGSKNRFFVSRTDDCLENSFTFNAV